MATEFSTAGYSDLRTYVEANWKYIEIRKSDNSALLRKTTSDARVRWAHSSGAAVLILEITLSGSDADVSLPVTVNRSAVYKAASGGSALSEDAFTAVTLAVAEDKITIRHSLQIPQV